MAKFRSTDNPNVTVEFTNENDIAEMRRHPQYVEVKEEDEKPTVKPTKKEGAK
jgi:hypothetical protein